MIEPQQVQERGMQSADVNNILDGIIDEFIRCRIGESTSSFNAARA